MKERMELSTPYWAFFKRVAIIRVEKSLNIFIIFVLGYIINLGNILRLFQCKLKTFYFSSKFTYKIIYSNIPEKLLKFRRFPYPLKNPRKLYNGCIKRRKNRCNLSMHLPGIP